jgi:glycosyltransferase involved in cell wall biosynthesis
MGRLFANRGPAWAALRAVYRAAHRSVARGAEVTVFQNEDDRRYFEERDLLRGGRAELVRGSGVDLEGLRRAAADPARVAALRRELAPDGAPIVLMVARVVPSKGVRELLDAARRVPRARFVLAGPLDAAERSSRALEAELRRGQVAYLGPRSDVPLLLSAAAVFALPTYYREGLPRVLLEAAALDVPLVGTPVAGCRDVVRHEDTGLVVPPRDAAALAAAVERLLDDQALGRRLAANARAHVERHFSLERVAADYARIYASLLGGRFGAPTELHHTPS